MTEDQTLQERFTVAKTSLQGSKIVWVGFDPELGTICFLTDKKVAFAVAADGIQYMQDPEHTLGNLVKEQYDIAESIVNLKTIVDNFNKETTNDSGDSKSGVDAGTGEAAGTPANG